MKTLRQYILRKSQQRPTPEEAQEMREAMRGRTADSAEDNPTAEHGQRYAVFQECPNCGQQLHGVHRVRANGSVDPRAVHYNDDANEAEKEADDRTVKAAYKSMSKGCPCCGTSRSECTCNKDCKHCTCHRKGLREYVDRDHDNA